MLSKMSGLVTAMRRFVAMARRSSNMEQRAAPSSPCRSPPRCLSDVHYNGRTDDRESFWALMKRGLHGTYHHVSVKHLGRYVNEFSGRHNDRPSDTVDQMSHIVKGMEGKRLRYEDLTAK